MKSCTTLLFVGACLLFSSQAANAQAPASKPGKQRELVIPKAFDNGGKGVVEDRVYDVVEQMPRLPGGGGETDIAMTIAKAVVLAKSDTVGGRVMLSGVVAKDGTFGQLKVVNAPTPSLGKAVLAAAQKLPKLNPGMQNGVKVPVRLTLPIRVEVR